MDLEIFKIYKCAYGLTGMETKSGHLISSHPASSYSQLDQAAFVPPCFFANAWMDPYICLWSYKATNANGRDKD